MQSRILLNVLMLISVLALAIAAWFVYQDKHAVQYLSSLPATEVKRIVIPREHGDIVLVANAEGWRMQQPFAMPAHAFRVQSLLKLLQTPVTQSYSASELDLAQLGLMPSRASIRFNDREIHFGKSNPVNHKRYLLSEDRVYLLNDSLYPLVSAEAASLISLTLLEPGMTINKIALPKLILQKSADNAWHDQDGKIVAADSAQQLLDNWQAATAYSVHAYMARPNAKPVVLQFNNQPALHLLVVADTNALIIGRPDAGVEYHFDAQYAANILQLPVISPQPEPADQPAH